MRSYKDLNIDYQGGDLIIQEKMLTSLVGCPETITRNFDCYGNSLTTLVGGPQKVDGFYDCRRNAITDLIGCASHIGRSLDIGNTQGTTFIGIHKIIKSCHRIRFNSEHITEGGIGLLLIANLTEISSYSKPFYIISSYLGTGTKGMMECSKELISKGYANYAKL